MRFRPANENETVESLLIEAINEGRYEKSGYSLEIGYDDGPGGDVISFGNNNDYPISGRKAG